MSGGMSLLDCSLVGDGSSAAHGQREGLIRFDMPTSLMCALRRVEPDTQRLPDIPCLVHVPDGPNAVVFRVGNGRRLPDVYTLGGTR